ncbi:hypothetical protein R1flu_022141 [Riccia fluitans]|uniref:Uncharacterized protein n=1 Tax=Riccia fluitans TaxID=41844 RepID=A0ABD1ZRC3_9MARC
MGISLSQVFFSAKLIIGLFHLRLSGFRKNTLISEFSRSPSFTNCGNFHRLSVHSFDLLGIEGNFGKAFEAVNVGSVGSEVLLQSFLRRLEKEEWYVKVVPLDLRTKLIHELRN